MLDTRLHRFRFFRQIAARPRLILSALAGMIAVFALPTGLVHHLSSRLIIGWNVGAWLYLALALEVIFCSSHERMNRLARLQDEGRLVILALVVLAAAASLSAIVAELLVVKDMQGAQKYWHIALAALTVISSWALPRSCSPSTMRTTSIWPARAARSAGWTSPARAGRTTRISSTSPA